MRIPLFSGIAGRLQACLFGMVPTLLAPAAAAQAAGLTVADMAGRQIELPAKVDRILLAEGRLPIESGGTCWVASLESRAARAGAGQAAAMSSSTRDKS